MEDIIKLEQDCIFSGVKWIKVSVVSFDLENNCFIFQDGCSFSYEYLVVCFGI